MKISLIEKKSNMEALNKIDEPRHIIKTMRIKKTKFVGLIVKHSAFIVNNMGEKISEKKEEGDQG